MRILRKMINALLDLLEIYIPMVSFSLMFIIFIVQIFYRYVLHSPLGWPVEVTQLAYIWTIFLGACYVSRKKEHIVFSIVYDLFSPKTKAILTMIGAFLVAILIIISIPSTLEYFDFLKRRKTNILDIPFNLAYAPYLVFIVMISLYSLRDFWKGVKELKILKQNKRENYR